MTEYFFESIELCSIMDINGSKERDFRKTSYLCKRIDWPRLPG